MTSVGVTNRMSELGDLKLGDLMRPERTHRTVYTDQSIFDLEMARIFENSWVFVAHESEVPNEGDYKATRIGRQPVIVTRSPAGIQVLMNRCMHRGAIVCREQSGNAETFRCMYHGWTYDSDGKLIRVPGRKEYEADFFDTRDFNLLPAARVGTLAGFVFASLSDEVEPLDDHLATVRHHFDALLDSAPEGKLRFEDGVVKYMISANWKIACENIMDGAHGAFTHENTLQYMMKNAQESRELIHAVTDRADKISREESLPTEMYIESHPRGHGVMGGATADEVPSIYIFPNLYIQPVNSHYRVYWPLSPGKTEVECYFYRLGGAPEQQQQTMLTAFNWWATASAFGTPEDIEAFAKCQEGFEARAVEWLDFSRGLHREVCAGDLIIGHFEDETANRGMHREWLRLMSVDDLV